MVTAEYLRAFPHRKALTRNALSQWATLALGVWLMANSGLTYSFSDYSPALKSPASLDLSQTELQLVGSIMNFGGYFGLPAGLLYDSLSSKHHKQGPKVVIAVGVLLNLVGYQAMYLASSTRYGKVRTLR